MKKLLNLLLLTFLLVLLASVKESKAQYSIPAKMKWWYEARFGMFIHFGSYSYLGYGEWAFASGWSKSNYQNQVSANFNPTNFNATTIAGLAKKAGMKYMVITAKHHEGFSMWKTGVQSFKDVTGTKLYSLPDYTKFGSRDILMELKNACDAQGIKFCLYYSIIDWNHWTQQINNTSFTTMASFDARTSYINDMKSQLNELITKYHPAVMWFDGDWTYNSGSPTLPSWWTKSDGIDLYNYLVGLDPNLVINERVARGFGLGDFESPEQYVPNSPLSRAWETNQTMNNSWGYNVGDNNYKTPQTLIRQLVSVISRDGNYLLNIGPKGDGAVTDQSVSILNNMGAWMTIYGESIYGATRSPFSSEPSWGFYTKKTGKLYAHVFNWPTNGQLQVPSSFTPTISKIYLLNAPNVSLNYSVANGTLTISVPANAPNLINSVVVIDATGGGCTPTAIAPYIQINGGTWTQASTATLNSGGAVAMGPQPTTGGSWSWTGPNGFSASTREVTISNIQTTQAGNYVAKYTNAGGCLSSQTFTITVNGSSGTGLASGRYEIVARNSGKALDVNGYSTADGANVHQWTYNGSANQQWDVLALGGGEYRITAVHSGKGLDVAAGSTADGANIQQYTYSGGANQRFRIESVGSGYYRIVAVNSIKCLDVAAGSTTDGANVQQYTCSGSNNQQWSFITIASVAKTVVNNQAEAEPTMVNIFPNPSKSYFIVEYPKELGKVSIKIYDSKGTLVLEKNAKDGKADFNDHFAPGIYSIKINNTLAGKRLIIN